MAYNFYTNYLAKPVSYGNTRAAGTVKYLVIHYTGNKTDTAQSNAKYFAQTNTRAAGAHYFVDSTSVYLSIPESKIAWSVGGNKYVDVVTTGGGSMYGKITNTNSISIEICSTNGEFSKETIENARILALDIMKRNNIPASNVYRHFDVNGKHCPGWEGWFGPNIAKWDEFKKSLGASVSTTAPVINSSNTSYNKTQFIKDVQRAIGVTVDGIAGPKTLAATVTISKKINNKHAVVLPVQKYLNAMGYNCGTADGIAGTKFDAALKAYQSKWMSKPDGEATAKGTTWKKLLGLA